MIHLKKERHPIPIVYAEHIILDGLDSICYVLLYVIVYVLYCCCINEVYILRGEVVIQTRYIIVFNIERYEKMTQDMHKLL